MKIIYERETCGRCLGTGRYSYNLMDGDRCYGCGGSGKRLTKRAAAAKREVGAAARRMELDVAQLVAEDVVNLEQFFQSDADGHPTTHFPAEFVEVVAVVRTEKAVGWSKNFETGEMVPGSWIMDLTVRRQNGETMTIRTHPYIVKRARRTEAERAAMIAAARRHPGACEVTE